MILINSSPKDTLRIFQPFLPISVPIGLGYLLAAAEREGIHARLIDEQVQDNVFDLVAEYTQAQERPYFFGFSVLTASVKRAIVVAQRLKELYPDAIICFGGHHPTASPAELLSYEQIDVVVRGEGECILPQLYQCVREGRDFTHLKGISYRQNNQIVHNRPAPLIQDLDALPPFPYHLFTSNRYDLGFIVSSRGCPYDCIFCSNRVATGKRYRFRSPDDILDDLEMLYRKYGRRFVLFVDDNLLVNRARIYHLLDGIKTRGLHHNMTFSFQARGDNVDYPLLRDLYSAGFRSVFFGLETASERLMQIIKKHETVEQCSNAVRMAKQIGFHVSATFIYALPGETHADRMACMKLSKELELDMVRYNNATPYPGTELYEIAKREEKLYIQGLYENFNSVATFIENPLHKIPFSYVPEGNSEQEIRHDILFSYLMFYLDLKRIKRILTTPDEGVKWFTTGNKFLEQIKKIPALFLLGGILFLKFSELLLNITIQAIKNCFKVIPDKNEKRTTHIYP
jgi:anaerobic magnesium-protoporphyrin IX monomethyl ester cyclase